MSGETYDPGTLAADAPDGGPISSFEHPRYEDLGLIGVGGMGEVRRVHDRRLGTSVAMKLLAAPLVAHGPSRRRFDAEARVTAMLRHPGIVAVQDMGELEDGRLWYTMTEVQGQTLAAVHADSRLRQRIDRLAQVGRAIAYAHTLGVVHRDLKPDNIMVGAFGEVRVMDWGIAQWTGGRDVAGEEGTPGPVDETRMGDQIGTPDWMAPEQASGDVEAISSATDVHALGSLLEWSVTGARPGKGAWPPGSPHELRAAAERARSTDPTARGSAAELVAELEAWLDGARRRQEAMRLVEQADALAPAIASDQQRAEHLAEQAATVLAEVLDHQPIADKRPAWNLEKQASALRIEAATARAEWLAALRSALVQVPDLAEAHARLAAYHAARVKTAERHGQAEIAAQHVAQLQQHDRGAWSAFLEGTGTVSIGTSPAGAEVRAFRYEEDDRQLVPTAVGTLGITPLHDVSLAHGSYLLELHAAGRAVVRHPILVRRGEAWSSVEPGATEPYAIPLPTPGEVPEGTVYVAAGWFEPGGDPEALDPARLGPVWVDGFFLARDPVTWGEYLAFLDAQDEPDPHLPRTSPTRLEARVPTVRRVNGRWRPTDDRPDRCPITELTWPSMLAYAQWRAEQDGWPWRLPHGVEWEKACRGVDHRPYATGWHLEPTRTNISSSSPDAADLVPVDALDQDRSPYGVRGLTGNASDMCGNAWLHRGGVVEDHRLVPPAPLGPDDMPELRGGNYAMSPRLCRAATRLAGIQDVPIPVAGFRLAATHPR